MCRSGEGDTNGGNIPMSTDVGEIYPINLASDSGEAKLTPLETKKPALGGARG